MNPRRLILVLAAAMLAGCAIPRSDLLAKDKPLTSDKDGLILVSLGYRGSNERFVKHIQQKPTIRLVVTPRPGRPDEKIQLTTQSQFYKNGAWGDEEVVRRAESGGRLLVGYRVPAGSYELLERHVELHAGSTNWSARLPLAAPWSFTVAPGQVTYIGAHVLHTQTGENWLGMAVPSRAKLVILDELKEDMEVLRRVRPELREVTTNDALRNWPLE